MWYLHSFVESLLTIVVWVLFAAVVCGIGRVFCTPKWFPQSPCLAATFIVGMSGLLFCAAVWRFWSPIDGPFSVVVLFLGLAGVVLYGREFHDLRRLRVPVQRTEILAGVFVLACLWRVANDATTYVPQVDGYHFTSLRWTLAQPYVKGLANLEGRLGFNSGVLGLYAIPCALLGDRGLGVVNGTLYFSMLFAFWRSLGSLCTGGNDAFAGLGLLSVLTLPTWLYRDFYSVGGVSPDTFLLLSLPAVSLFLANDLSERDRSEGWQARTLIACFALSILITVKLSSVFFCGPLVLAICWQHFRHGSTKSLIVAAFSFAIPLVSWAITNVIQSGWLIYPVPMTRLPVPWSVPLSTGVWEKQVIVDFARFSGQLPVDPEGEWLHKWFWNLVRFEKATFLIPLGLLIALWVGNVIPNRSRSFRPVIFGMAFLCGIIGWFFNGPSPRFLAGSLFSMLAVLISYPIGIKRQSRYCKWTLTGIGLLWISAVAHRAIQDREVWKSSPMICFRECLVRTPPNASGRFEFPEPLTFYSHPSADPTIPVIEGYAWKAPLICTTRPNPDFEALSVKLNRDGVPEFQIVSD